MHDQLHRLLDSLSLRENRRSNSLLLVEHERDGFGDGELVEVYRARMALLGRRKSERLDRRQFRLSHLISNEDAAPLLPDAELRTPNSKLTLGQFDRPPDALPLQRRDDGVRPMLPQKVGDVASETRLLQQPPA